MPYTYIIFTYFIRSFKYTLFYHSSKAIFAENGHALTKFIEKDIPARCVKYLLDSWNMPIVCRKFLSLITGWKVRDNVIWRGNVSCQIL